MQTRQRVRRRARLRLEGQVEACVRGASPGSICTRSAGRICIYACSIRRLCACATADRLTDCRSLGRRANANPISAPHSSPLTLFDRAMVRLITHNMLACHAKGCTANNFPLQLKDVTVAHREADFSDQFLRNFIPRLEWTALVDAARQVYLYSLEIQ